MTPAGRDHKLGAFMRIRRIPLVFLACLLMAAILPPATGAAREGKTLAPGVWGDLYPAMPEDMVVNQPDGTTFKANLTNAEIGGNLEYEGYTVKKRNDGWWVYATGRDENGLIASDRRVGIDAAPAGLDPQVGRVDNVWTRSTGYDLRTQVLEQLRLASLEAQKQATQGGEPRVFKFPVLMLATWWDAEAGQTSPQFQEGNTAEHFKKLLDGFGGNSRGTLTEFYFENSYGQFLVQVDVYGPYTSARSVQDRCYYGGIDPPPDEFDDLDPTDSVLGVGGGGAAGMAAEAVPQADPTVDFSQYDNDGDGDVDFTGLLHSGPDMAATGDPCHTWSHAIDASFGTAAGVPTNDGVTVGRVFTMPEINLEIGVATHEMAHALGEPDYYNPDYVSAGTGDWDIMAGGSWFGNPPGSNPTGFNPASKVFQGWMTPRIINGDQRAVELKPRELIPKPGYQATEANPNILLVPTEWVKVGEPDRNGDTWTEDDVSGLVQDGDKGYVVEGYYIENWSRTVNGPPIHPDMTRAPYFDRQALASGIMAWHFDYYYRSNTINGSNNAGSDPNRPQMDPIEFDYNDNTQELQLNLTRGEPSDVMWGAATGITSGTRMLPPGIRPSGGEPQAPIEISGTVLPTQTADSPFTVENDPDNYSMTVEISGLGDCTLEVLKVEGDQEQSVGGPSDSGAVGDAESVEITQPAPGNYIARVGDFAACGDYQGTVTFASSGGSGNEELITTGAGDTWSNWSKQPTGWAFTNVRPHGFFELSHTSEAPGNGTMRLDVLNISSTETDLSPGFARPKATSADGLSALNVSEPSKLTIPIFNNGGKEAKNVKVALRRGTKRGPVIAKGQIKEIPGYSRRTITFDYRPRTEGFTTIVTEVDRGKAIKEVNEANNFQESDQWAGPRNPKVLVVDDDGSTDSESLYAGTLASLGIPYAIQYGNVDASTMKKFQAVVWEGGLERYQGQLNEADRTAIKTYLDGGGRLLYTSPRGAAALGEEPGSTNPGSTADMPQFLRTYFGASYADTLQVGGGKVTGTGDILGKRDFQMDVFPGRPLQDVFKIAAPPEGEAPIGEVRPIASWEKGGEGALMGTRVAGDTAHDKFRSVFLGLNLRQLTSTDDSIYVMDKVMKHFGVKRSGYSTPKKPVIYHSQVRNRIEDTDTPINAVVLGKGFKGPVQLAYRIHGSGRPFKIVKMTKGSGNGSWSGQIPGSFVTPNAVEYYIKAGRSFDPGPAVKKVVYHAIGVGPN